jgi:putative ATPase
MAQEPQAPLAERIRPQTLDAFVGQTHLLGEQGPLRQLIAGGQLPSLILWGPPGTGKTTLALLIARELERPLVQLSAVQAGVKEVRAQIQQAAQRPGTILFIDEIHRFNKGQQDALLHAVERGEITLIGATTENPSFEVIAPLLSRCQVYTLEGLTLEDLQAILERALAHDAVLSQREVRLEALQGLYSVSGGDARKALNLVEMIAGSTPADEPVRINDETVMQVARRKIARYDKQGEQHYDQISAFIKSVRGGDPNGALYWLARMMEGGEEVRFIARRLIILASEDIGNANPNALLLANACFQACDVVGWPEARIILAQTTTYLATSEKSNAAYEGIEAARQAARQAPDLPVPLHLRNAPTQLMKASGYGAGYKYTHAYEAQEGLQQYLPDDLAGQSFYQPKPIGKEQTLRDYMLRKWGAIYEQRGA